MSSLTSSLTRYHNEIKLVPAFLSIVEELMLGRCPVVGLDGYTISLAGRKFFIDVRQSELGSANDPVFYVFMRGEHRPNLDATVYSSIWDRGTHYPELDALVRDFLRRTAFYHEYAPMANKMSDYAVSKLFMERMGINMNEHV